MTGTCWLIQTALIAMFLSATLVKKGLGQKDIQNGGIAYVTEGFNAELLWTYTLPPGIPPLFQTWRKLPDTGIASRTDNTYISIAYHRSCNNSRINDNNPINYINSDSNYHSCYNDNRNRYTKNNSVYHTFSHNNNRANDNSSASDYH
ncbi:uncharacterized protein LOC144877370 [Branchiostoma floridae x Branchiostoma japonicum]